MRLAPLFAAAVGLFAASISSSFASDLPNLEGRTIVAVTENAYTPLNFVDPKTGEGIGWEYDAFNEIAKRLNAKVDWQLSSWDTMIQAVRDGQFDVGMDGITITEERATQIDFSEPI
jgi:polar amino acid transport system substrate-binding protein